jgi:hypothetical protein
MFLAASQTRKEIERKIEENMEVRTVSLPEVFNMYKLLS